MLSSDMLFLFTSVSQKHLELVSKTFNKVMCVVCNRKLNNTADVVVRSSGTKVGGKLKEFRLQF